MDPRVSRCPLQTRTGHCPLQQPSSSVMTTAKPTCSLPTASFLSPALGTDLWACSVPCGKAERRGEEAGPGVGLIYSLLSRVAEPGEMELTLLL